MDGIWDQVATALAALWDKIVAYALELGDAAWHKAMDFLIVAAGAVDRLAGRLAAVPPWMTIGGAVVLLGLAVAYAARQPLYDRFWVYHLFWLRWRGFSRQRFAIRRGAVREIRFAMARRVPLADRFADIAVYEAHPDRYLVAYGVAGGRVEDVRTYRRDRRAGITAMATDLTAYFRTNARMVHAEAELRVLFASLDGFDPVFAGWRGNLPGEVRRPARGVSLPVRTVR